MAQAPDFGTLLRRWRTVAGLTQEDLAERAGLSPRGIRALEQGERQRPYKHTVRLLADALELTEEDRSEFEAAARWLDSPRQRGSSTAQAEPAGSAVGTATGVRTFLIADIRGYTRFTQDNGDAAAARLAGRFANVAKELVEARGGVVTELRGDDVLAVFDSPRRAMQAAVDLQIRCMQETKQDPHLPLNVGVGIDAGEAVPVHGGYRGGALNLAARLCSLAGPGETLVSAELIHLARKTEGLAYLDRGQVRLKGLSDPVRVFQVVPGDSVPTDVPRFSLHVAPPSNLPVPVTQFIGRERETMHVSGMLRRKDVRLVTLTGAGGVGKTRLALQVAKDVLSAFRDGVFFVSLAAVGAPQMVSSAIAGALNLQEAGGRAARETIKDHLRDKEMLLVLDNLDHLIQAAPLLGDMLRACPQLKLLVTSRAVLHLAAEHLYAVPPLALPEAQQFFDLDALSRCDAIAFFVDRAKAARADFLVADENATAIADICNRLDGLPLAIELAAAWTRLMPPQAILARLGSRLQLLVGGTLDKPERQQTLRAAIEWSHSQLDAAEQTFFARLAVFVGGFTLEAAECVCTQTTEVGTHALVIVTSLVDKSLLHPVSSRGDEIRFSMLETVREYALERLAEIDDVHVLRRRHAYYALALAERAAREMFGPTQALWLDRLETEHGNLSAALQWILQSKETELGLQLVEALWRFWQARGYLREGSWWMESLLSLDCSSGGEETVRAGGAGRAKALMLAGAFRTNLGDYDRGGALAAESLDLYRGLEDLAGVASALNVLGNISRYQGALQHARAVFEESLNLRRKLGSRQDIAMSLNNLASVAVEQGDTRRAMDLYEESLKIERELGDGFGIALVLSNLGQIEMAHGRYDHSVPLFEEGLALYRKLGNVVGMANSLTNLAIVAREQGSIERAALLHQEALSHYLAVGDKWGWAECLERLAGVTCARGEPELAGRLFGAASAVRDAIGVPVAPSVRPMYDADVAAVRAALGDDAFEAAWAGGRALSTQQVSNVVKPLTRSQPRS